MPKTAIPYNSWLAGELTDPKIAERYLNASPKEGPDGFLKALKKVAQARQMTKVAQEAGVQRETLYRSLSENGNPTLETLSSVLHALGMELRVAARQ